MRTQTGYFVARRIWQAVVNLLLVMALLFVLVRAIPKSAVSTARYPSPAAPTTSTDTALWPYDAEQAFGPQFRDYLLNAFRLEFGTSPSSGGQAVRDLIGRGLPISLQLMVLAGLIGILGGVPLGVIAAQRPAHPVSRFALALALFGRSVPALVLGPLLLGTFAFALGWFPTADLAGVWQRTLTDPGVLFSVAYLRLAALPVLSIAVGVMAVFTNWTRVTLRDLAANRLLTLRLRRQVLAISLAELILPVMTSVAVGAFVVEWIFQVPGLGSQFIGSVTRRDYPLLVGVMLVYSTLLVTSQALLDMVIAALDGRALAG
jgi:ABC-type dipeptide/oligopeptide/nickel transport system permease component